MPFATNDQKRIANLLKLPQDQYFADSLLAELMASLETTDTAQGTDLVTDVQLALAKAEAINIDAASQSDGILSKSIDNQYSVTYAAGGGSSSLKAKKQGYINDIKRLLDPNNQLEAYNTSGRVIQTL